MTDFLRQQQQRVFLTGRYFSWVAIKAGVQLYTWTMFFLMYIHKKLITWFISNPKLFTDDISLFSMVEKMTKSAKDLNNYLAKISTWAFQWKINFNPDLTNQAQEQPLKFNSAVSNCRGLCQGKQCFYNNHLGKNIAEVIT